MRHIPMWICLGPLILLPFVTHDLNDSYPPVQADSHDTVRLGTEHVYNNVPLAFEPNQGQADDEVKFLARGADYTLFLTNAEAAFVLLSTRPKLTVGAPIGPQKDEVLPGKWTYPPTIPTPVRDTPDSRQQIYLSTQFLRVVGAQGAAELTAKAFPREMTGVEKLSGKSNYFVAQIGPQWDVGIPNYRKVRYEELYSGVDLEYYGGQGLPEFDLVIRPGGDPGQVRLSLGLAESITREDQGRLLMRIGTEELVLNTPVIYQERSGVREPVSGGYVIKSKSFSGPTQRAVVGYELEKYDASRPLIIHHSISLGRRQPRVGNDIAVDSRGTIYLVAETRLIAFPKGVISQPLKDTTTTDVLVTKLRSNGDVEYTTYLSGWAEDRGLGIAVDSSGNAYVTGETSSTNFPTGSNTLVGGRVVQPAFGGGSLDGFVAKLDPQGDLFYSTFFGTTGPDSGRAIATDANGNAYVTGAWTAALPRADLYSAAFIIKLGATGNNFMYSVFRQFSMSVDGKFIFPTTNVGNDIAVDASGFTYVTGASCSGAGASCQAFVEALDADQASREAPAFAGYPGLIGPGIGASIAVDSQFNVYVTGETKSHKFPKEAAFQGTHGDFDKEDKPKDDDAKAENRLDAFVARFNMLTNNRVYSTYLGGQGRDTGLAIAVDSQGNAYVAGATESTDFLTRNAVQQGHGGAFDTFVVKIDAAGSALDYSTFLGGDTNEGPNGIGLDDAGNSYITGAIRPTILAMENAQPVPGSVNPGELSNFVVRIGPATDLLVTTSDFPPSVSAGGDLKYTLTVSNSGPADATGVVLTQRLSAGVSLTSATPTQGRCSESSGVVTCQLGNLAKEAIAAVSIQLSLNSSARENVRIVTSVVSNQVDPETTTNTAVNNAAVTASPGATPAPTPTSVPTPTSAPAPTPTTAIPTPTGVPEPTPTATPILTQAPATLAAVPAALAATPPLAPVPAETPAPKPGGGCSAPTSARVVDGSWLLFGLGLSGLLLASVAGGQLLRAGSRHPGPGNSPKDTYPLN